MAALSRTAFCQAELFAVLRFFMVMGHMDLLLLLLLAAFVWYWFDSLHALEIARAAGKRACLDANVQFLDDTVSRNTLRLTRNATGRVVFRRTYRFEFSETGDTRREGCLVMTGSRIESIAMEPYRIAS
ncbi:MAG TPA: DUF3301 domain-containing protein [Burkholderiales bacterium]|nr:DUF3301 domain-containing protein [Burkholderiales bacterium]